MYYYLRHLGWISFSTGPRITVRGVESWSNTTPKADIWNLPSHPQN